MTLIAAFSTDWSREPAPDEIKSQLTGKPEFIKDRVIATFGGTFYYHGAMPLMELAKHDGYEVFLSWTFRSLADGRIECMDTQGEYRSPDLIWVQRMMHKDAPDAFARAKAAGQIIVNDCDDNFWQLPKSNIAHQTTDPTSNPEFNRDHYRKAIAASSAITASTPSLVKELERLGPPVFLCRNMIDIERWQPHDPGADGMIGWIGGLQWRAAGDMGVLRQFLPGFLETHKLPFYHGGDSRVPGVQKVWDVVGIDPQRVQVAAAPLVHIGDYPNLFNPLNVSLIPLEDHQFNHAKSSLKALESSAAGIPYVASDLPEQRWFTEHGGMGRLAKNWKPQTWTKNLEELLDPEVRRKEGAANRAHAEEFDIRHNWTQWADVFEQINP